MSKIKNLKDLFIEQGRELQNSYEQELKELPKIEKKAGSTKLKSIINKHVQATKNQQDRLNKTFSRLNVSSNGNKNLATETILKEANRRINESENIEVCDACIIGSLQQLGHNRVADLGTLSAYAEEIGQETSAKLLHESFQEEKRLGRELIDLAKSDINKKAVQTTALIL